MEIRLATLRICVALIETLRFCCVHPGAYIISGKIKKVIFCEDKYNLISCLSVWKAVVKLWIPCCFCLYISYPCKTLITLYKNWTFNSKITHNIEVPSSALNCNICYNIWFLMRTMVWIDRQIYGKLKCIQFNMEKMRHFKSTVQKKMVTGTFNHDS